MLCRRRLAVLLLSALWRPHAAGTHYEQPPCQSDEVQGEVQGAAGYLCAPKCDEASYNCAMDMPPGASAQPQCMLQDIDRNAYCGLLCQVDAQCPSGARCKNIKQVEVGLCMYPISFADWAAQASNGKKLAIGWPGGKPTASFQIAKTYSALQNLKQKYSVDDGDADMLVLKELLSTLSAAQPAQPGAQPASPPSAAVAMGGAAALVAQGPPQAEAAPPQPQQHQEGTVYGAWSHDVNRIGNHLSRGLPGIEDEISQAAWDVEHIYTRNAASELLRGLILLALAYLAVGSFIKYQSGATGMHLIPHLEFWMEYPKLVNDGVLYSKMLIAGAAGSPALDTRTGGVSRGGGAGSFESL